MYPNQKSFLSSTVVQTKKNFIWGQENQKKKSKWIETEGFFVGHTVCSNSHDPAGLAAAAGDANEEENFCIKLFQQNN